MTIYLAIRQLEQDGRIVSWPREQRDSLETHMPAVWSRYFRPLRLGIHRDDKKEEVQELLYRMAEIWDNRSPNIPVSGGDSWTSYTRRLVKGFRLVRGYWGQASSLVVPVDLLSAYALREISMGNSPQPNLVALDWYNPCRKFFRIDDANISRSTNSPVLVPETSQHPQPDTADVREGCGVC